jgi:MoaA/NifB/PqqE/SkfB family radical SAM enzyme
MTPKDVLTNKCFCPMPWTGLMYNFDGTVRNCIRGADKEPIGNINTQSIDEILLGDINVGRQQSILAETPIPSCQGCYDLEQGKKSFDIISDRIFYIRELKHVPLETYQPNNHQLHTIDVRWSNLCNFGCVYCSPEYSSRWADELGVRISTPADEQRDQFKDYIIKHAGQLKHVYMAGGEPLLMKQNLELLDVLAKKNPNVNLRINTNLSKVDTQVFERVCDFKNVHWIVSVETTGQEFEYVRHGGRWDDFLENLETISKLTHKISFNMLYFLLNYRSMFDCIDYFLDHGYHPNSFIVGALLTPVELNIRHLPQQEIDKLKILLTEKINQHPGYLLEDSYQNLLSYIDQPFKKNLDSGLKFLTELDGRRGTDSQKIFPDLYNILQG